MSDLITRPSADAIEGVVVQGDLMTEHLNEALAEE